jgi:predicted phosphoribosyltransferase
MQPELAIGAIASGGIRVLNEDLIATCPGLDAARLEEVTKRETAELERREALYRGEHPFPDLAGRDIVLVDDGLATGATMRAAAAAVQSSAPAKVVVAVPVGAADAVRTLAGIVDDVICLDTPQPFAAIGYFYRDFSQTSDEEVRQLLAAARADDTGT